MNPSSDTTPAPHLDAGDAAGDRDQGLPSNWRKALMTLIASRITLIQLESKDVASECARRASYLVAAVCATVFAWALLIAGFVAVLSEFTELPWSWVAIGIGVLHLIVTFMLVRLATPSGDPAFPVTRAEFQKDREWIENFKQTRKSND